MVQPQLEVAGGMGRPSIFACNVAVVTDGVALEGFVTYVARLGGAEGMAVPPRHPQGLGISTPLISRSSSCSDFKKCSAAFGPRYSTGGSVWPSHRTTM